MLWDEMTEKDMSHLVQTCGCFPIIYYGTCISNAILSDFFLIDFIFVAWLGGTLSYHHLNQSFRLS